MKQTFECACGSQEVPATDCTIEEVRQEDLYKPAFAGRSHQTEQEEISALPLSPRYDTAGRELPTLSIYFRTINRCSVLDEREERIVAQRIKERGFGCTKGIIKKATDTGEFARGTFHS